MICDASRPCLRCIKRGIGHICHDEPTPLKQKKKDVKGGSQSPAIRKLESENGGIKPEPTPQAFLFNKTQPEAQLDLHTARAEDDAQRHVPITKNLVLSHEPFFYSEHAGSEFSSLNDFLSMIDDPELANESLQPDSAEPDILSFLMNPDGGSTQNLNSLLQFSPKAAAAPNFADVEDQNKSATAASFEIENGNKLAQKPESGVRLNKDHQPIISDAARDKFFLTAADPTTEISPEERLKQVIKAKLDAGLLQPYNYAKGYARLQSYMDNYMNQFSRQRILKPLLIFRPAFRGIARTLKDVDLVLVEESFERMLLDYDRVFTSMAIPACLWRRTGEIYRGNKEFASLVGVTTDDLKDGKLAIYELMSEESAVNFWEKYGAIAFDKGQKAVLTSCNLRTKDGYKRKSCCFSFTIRRDRYNIPSCIVGNFIPVDQ